MVVIRTWWVHLKFYPIGHYIAYCMVQQQPQRLWEMFSDERHVRVSEAEVLSAQATMLFYDRD
jgi:uncharacterized UBP type Zn finger protein